MNAIEFLIKEHNKVRELLSNIDDETHRYETKRKMFDGLAEDLVRHETMEHDVWYPHFKNQLPDAVRHLVTEEKIAEKAIHKLNEMQTESAWEEQFIKFKRDVEHHAKEEEDDLFPEVKRILSEPELEKIGLKMYEFKKRNTH